MKQLIFFMAITFIAFKVDANQNPNIITDSLDVHGNCNMCKERIENAAYIKGVKKVNWDKHKQILTVTYDKSKTSKSKILEAVAKAGHDNEMFKAPDAVYNRLPKCCNYRSSDAHIH
ncbi:MAG: cation transporter [Bacteroidales bacterium]|nr:cation transporter [Bacteroidales bacterium]